MSGSRWYQERKRDGYYKKAKIQGYRARSAYKLKQMQDRYHFLRKGYAVADLGCSPGGWSQVLVELVGPGGLVVGVDLQRTRPVDGAKFLQGDFTRSETQARVTEMLAVNGREAFDAVVSDMAPDMSGNYDLDQVRSVYLGQQALEFAKTNVRDGGHFLCKVFEGTDFLDFKAEVREVFGKVYQFAPAASRKQSSEVYIYARGLTAGHDDSEE